jgi:hypothetical protein
MSLLDVLKFEKVDQSNFLDARGPRFGAAVTTVLIALTLLTNSALLLGLVLATFSIGAFLGPKRTPYALIFRKLVQPRLKGEVPREDVRPPHFAQIVGFVFLFLGALAYLLDITALVTVALGAALGAAFLNAAFNYCLGCELYLLLARARSWVSRSKSSENSYHLPNL